MFWKTMLLPSGDQRGATCATSSLLSVVTCCGLCPSASTTQIRRGPAHEQSTATCLPEGENAGLKASRISHVSLPVRSEHAEHVARLQELSRGPHAHEEHRLPAGGPGWLQLVLVAR